jgi:hypothetical protein
MCVIMVVKDVKPSLDLLKKAELTNPDGAGIAWKGGDRIFWKKGLSAKDIFNLSQKLPLPQVIHFRMKTVGSGKELCHPFPITRYASTNQEGFAKKVLFHNGHWSDWKRYCLEAAVRTNVKFPNTGAWSDSRALAWLSSDEVLGQGILKLIDEKIVVFSEKKITIYGSPWTTVEGIFCSNDYFTWNSWRREAEYGFYEDVSWYERVYGTSPSAKYLTKT